MVVHYKPARLALWALISGLSGGYLLFGNAVDGSFVDTATGVLLLVTAGLAAVMGLGGRPALTTDAEGVAVRTLFSSRTVRWSELLVVQIERRQTQLAGIIPTGRQDFLSLMAEGGVLGSKRIRLRGSWLALAPGGLARLRDELLAARSSATTNAATVGSSSIVVDGSSFDPDAVLARYMAARSAELDAPVEAPAKADSARPNFGRRAASPVSPVDPVGLAR